jgi:hypothetical protein
MFSCFHFFIFRVFPIRGPMEAQGFLVRSKSSWIIAIFFGGRPLFHVLSWSAIAASLKAGGLHSMESICVR